MALRAHWGVIAAALLGAWITTGQASGQPKPGHEPAVQELPRRGPGQPVPGMPRVPDPHGAIQPRQPAGHGGPNAGHGAEQGGHGEHGATAGHGEHGGHDENGPPPPINWWQGLVGEKADAEPSLLWRRPGDPPPFLASLLNFGLLAFLAVKFGKKPLRDALVKRKESIVRELDEARRLRESAEKRLAEYEAKLEKIHEDLEQVRREFREQGEHEKERIVVEAKERRDRMRKDAELLLSQESKQLRQELVVEVVGEASRRAAEILTKEMTLGDHDKFAEKFLAELRAGSRGRTSGAVAPSAAAKGGLS